MNVKLWHGGTNECKAIAWRNKWMSTYIMEKLIYSFTFICLSML